MARSADFQKRDQKEIDRYRSNIPELTEEQAREVVRQDWIMEIAQSYQNGAQPMFGEGFTAEDDVWLAKVKQAIRDKKTASPIPAHQDPKIQAALNMAGA